MSSTRPRPTLAPAYRKALNTWRPVILYFGNSRCPACEIAEPIFRQVAEQYRDRASIYVLNTGESPRHPNVTGTPTVLFYQDANLREKLKGIDSKQFLSEVFARHVTKRHGKKLERKPRHDLPWLRHILKTLCQPARARNLLERSLFDSTR